MNLSEIEYTTRPYTIGDWRLLQRVIVSADGGTFDAESLVKLILVRTNLSEDEATSLDMSDAIVVLTNISEAIKQAITLQKLGDQL